MNTDVEKPAIAIVRGQITGPRGVVLEGIDLVLRNRRSVALLGPVSTGKSALMRAMTGQPDAPGFRRSGSWQQQGQDIPSGALNDSVRWLPQGRYRPPHPHESFSRPPAVSRWEEAFDSSAAVVLLDEPDATEEPQPRLVTAIRNAAKSGLVVTVTHNLEFARAIADEIVFVGDKRVQLHIDGREFFANPPSEEARTWVATGSCSWPTKKFETPNHFHWILPKRLAAMGRPGLTRDMDEDLASLAEQEIRLLVTLTREPLVSVALRSHGIEGRHFPIVDMGVPSVLDVAGVCSDAERRLADGQRIAVHCRAGLGRTGTVVACMLCWLGMKAQPAVEYIRGISRGFIQTRGQLRFVEMFDETYGGAGSADLLRKLM